MPPVRVGIALGSNLGDRAAELDAGVAFLRGLSATGRLRESPRIETRPVDCPPGSGPFLNSVVEVEIDDRALPPRRLLGRLQAFETQRGRPARHEFNAPRTLDLDIVFYGDRFLREPGLAIPHPRFARRWFVLAPLFHLEPDLVLPGQRKSVRRLLEEIAPGAPDNSAKV